MSKPDSWLAFFEWELVDEFKKNVEQPYQELKRQYPEGLKEWRKKCVGDQTYMRNILQHKFVHKLSHKAQNYKKIYSKQTLISIIVLILRMFYVSISLHRIVRCIIT